MTNVRVLLATFEPNPIHLYQQLKSIFSQSNVNVFLTISDDSKSNINVRDLVLSFSDIPSHKITFLPGPGVNSACSNFLSIVQRVDPGDCNFFAFSDQDDIWMPDKLVTAIRCILRSLSGFYTSELSVWDEHLDFSNSYLSKRWRQKRALFGLFYAEGAGCTMVLSRHSFVLLHYHLIHNEYLRLRTPPFSHDLYVSSFLTSRGLNCFHDRQSFIYYRQHSHNVWSGSKFGIAYFRQRLPFLFDNSFVSLLNLTLPPLTLQKSFFLTSYEFINFLSTLYFRLSSFLVFRRVLPFFSLRQVILFKFSFFSDVSLILRARAACDL